LAVELPAARIAELEAEFFPNIDRIVLTQTIEAYQRLGCWQGEHAITPESFEKTLDVFLYSGDITGRFAYSDLVCAAPE
jgi:hypothetical protein